MDRYFLIARKRLKLRHIDHLGEDSLDEEGKELYYILKGKLEVWTENLCILKGNVQVQIKEEAKDEERFVMDVVLNQRDELRNYIKNNQNGEVKTFTSTGLDKPAQTSKHDNDNQLSPQSNLVSLLKEGKF